uniref:Beta-amylase n=1 Tax=Kalanchoe fedtschenkoi TaxID=63787 RepID=A0A7N0ZVV3_KALFE
MAAIASPPNFAASLCSTRSDSHRFLAAARLRRCPPFIRQLRVCSRLNSSRSSGHVSPDNGGDLQYDLHYGLSPRKGSPVFVTLPVDVVGPSGQVRRKKAMTQSFRALTAAGVEGVVMEVWWGVVEKVEPGVYNWEAYMEIVAMARKYGLKVRAVMAFHQCGSGPEDPYWIPLPQWVLEEINRDPDIAYSDRFGRRSMEYISLGCDFLPVLQGRTPIQAYSDFMRNFRDTFRHLFDTTITGIRVGMGPGGELRYPLCPSEKLIWAWRPRELGEFQCYDKYMLASLNACAREIGMLEWGNGGPIGASSLTQNQEETEFFKSDEGSWNTPYGKFFLGWYSSMLLLHGERICREAETIFRGTGVIMSAKVAGIHWHYSTQSHPSELTAGYYNTSTRDGFLPIVRMFGRYGFTVCCTCFEMRDEDEKQMNLISSPEGFLKQLLLAVRICNLPLEGENTATRLDDESYEQVMRTSKLFLSGVDRPSFSFNFVRMDKNLFEYQNWVRFTRFVRQMSYANIFRARLDFGGNMFPPSTSNGAKLSLALAGL